jgi:hypothetical protein
MPSWITTADILHVLEWIGFGVTIFYGFHKKNVKSLEVLQQHQEEIMKELLALKGDVKSNHDKQAAAIEELDECFDRYRDSMKEMTVKLGLVWDWFAEADVFRKGSRNKT